MSRTELLYQCATGDTDPASVHHGHLVRELHRSGDGWTVQCLDDGDQFYADDDELYPHEPRMVRSEGGWAGTPSILPAIAFIWLVFLGLS